MKLFSTAWKSSKDPGKQRKYRAKAPLHLRVVFVSAHLSKELRATHKRRAVPIRSGDGIKILRGTHKGKTGTVERVDRDACRIYVTGITYTKRDGSTTLVPVEPSNTLITSLAQDKRRIEAKP